MNALIRRQAIHVSQWVGKRRRKLETYFSNLKRKRDALEAFQLYDQHLETLAAMEAPARVSTPRGNSITAIYFSCHGHFGMLDMSLQSLLSRGSHLQKIWVYEDASDPFTASERMALRNKCPNLSLTTGPRVTGWGYETLLRELAAFRRIAHDPAVTATGWIMKLDSDVLFLNDRLFSQVARCNADIFGQPFRHSSGLTYVQGGCYFIATHFVDTLVSSQLAAVMQALALE